MDDQGFDVRHVGKQGENFQIVDKLVGLLLTALDFEGEDRAAAIGEVFLIKGMVGMAGQAGMIDLFHLGMVCQERNHLFRVLGMAVKPQG